MVMNRAALKWKLLAVLVSTSVSAAVGLGTMGVNYLLEVAMGSKRVTGENWVIFLSFSLFGLISGIVFAAKSRPRVWG